MFKTVNCAKRARRKHEAISMNQFHQRTVPRWNLNSIRYGVANVKSRISLLRTKIKTVFFAPATGIRRFRRTQQRIFRNEQNILISALVLHRHCKELIKTVMSQKAHSCLGLFTASFSSARQKRANYTMQ